VKKSNSQKWRYFFIALLIFNIQLGAPAILLLLILLPSFPPRDGASGFGTIILLLIIATLFLITAVVDLISMIAYIRSQHPYGKSKVVSYVILTLSSSYLICFLIYLSVLFFRYYTDYLSHR